MNKKNVLFICTGNTARSQMAEAFLRLHGGDRFNALSAGVEPGVINPFTIKTMAERGIDIGNQKPQSLHEYMGKETIHYAIFVCEKAEENCPAIYIFGLNKLSWPFEDPAAFEGSDEEKSAKFGEVRDEIEQKVLDWLEKV